MKIKFLMKVFALATFLLAQPAVAGPLEDADAAYNQGDYANALQLWRHWLRRAMLSPKPCSDHVQEARGVPQDFVHTHRDLEVRKTTGTTVFIL